LGNFVVHSEKGKFFAYQGEISPLNIKPTFDNGFLVVYGGSVTVVYSPDGSPFLRLPRPDNGAVWNVAVDTDGTVATVGAYRGHTAGGIAIFDRTGSQTRFIDTSRFFPTQVCFAPDHSIWVTISKEQPDHGGIPDFFLRHHYSRDGKELGAFLPQSSFPSARNPAEASVGGWRLRIANNRIGAILGHGSHERLWIELDLTGKELGRWPIDIDGYPNAFTAQSTVYASAVGGIIMVLDHETGKWIPDTSIGGGGLLGAEGNSLVFEDRSANLLFWVPVSR
jgi:hypothetical protein